MSGMAARRFGAYHRISRLNGRDLDSENTISDKDAWERIDGWATMRGVDIVERYLDTDVSGSKMKRPELDRMLADLEAGVIDGIVVAQVDRLSRADVGDALTVIKKIVGDEETPKHPLALLDLGIDPATEFGEFGLTILLGLARMQWRRYKRTWSTAQKRAVKRGLWIGPAPLGYRATKVRNPKTDKLENGPLEPDPKTQPIVREAFQIAASEGLHAAMAYLQQKVPDRTWRTAETRRLLSARAYLGEVVLGELRNPKAHQPLVTPAIWQAAQTKPRSRRTNGDYPLSGIATCGACGEGLNGQLQTVEGRQYRRYRCSNPACGGGSSISADKLEVHVRETLANWLGNKRFVGRRSANRVDDAQQVLENAQAELQRYMADLETRALVGHQAWQHGAQARSEAVEAAREHFGVVAGQTARVSVLPAAHELEDPEMLLAAIRAMVAEIVVARGRGRIDERVSIRAVPVNDLEDGPRVAAL